MKQLRLIIFREYLTKVRNKSFLLMTLLSPLAVVVLSLVIGYLTQVNSNTERHIQVLDLSGSFAKAFEADAGMTYSYTSEGDLSTLQKQSQKQGDYGLLYIDTQATHFEFFSEDTPSPTFLEKIQGKVEKALFFRNLQRENIDPSQIDKAQERVKISLTNFSGDKSSETAGWLKLFFGSTAGYLLMIFIVVYGNMIMRSVIEEKVNRIVEVIISSVPARTLLLGKIIGTSLVGITQFAIWLLLGGALLSFLPSLQGSVPATVDSHMLSDLITEVNTLPLGKLSVCFLLYFIGGYLVYSAFYAMIGAAVDSETDTQQFLLPVLTPLILAIYVGIFTVIEAPHGTVSVIFSYIPLTSSVVMLMRIPFGVSWGELLLSLGLLYAFFFLSIWVAARIYRVGILSYGKKPSYKELFKWLRMSN
ncbi:ABC transporter permease [Capnocytophaga gingivalis]